MSWQNCEEQTYMADNRKQEAETGNKYGYPTVLTQSGIIFNSARHL
jgi:hypothetical protein